MVSWLHRFLGRADAHAAAVPPVITADITGFSLTTGRQSRAVPWQLVSRVAAFKQDLHTHDRIVLLVELIRAGGETLTLSEECPGFASLFGPMEQALGVDPSWYLEIMTPAFAPSPTVLYLRAEREE